MKRRSLHKWPRALLLAVVLWAGRHPAPAGLATAWHIPDNGTDLGFHMRDPEFEIGTNTTVALYTGVWKWNNGTQICNQTGGTLYYRSATQAGWSSVPLTWLTNTAANQYWQAAFNTSAFGPDDVIQYYFLLTFDGSNGVTNVMVTETSFTVSGSYGAHLYATVTAVNNAGIESAASPGAGVALVNPSWVPSPGMASSGCLTWPAVSGAVYQVWSTTNLGTPFVPYSDMVTAATSVVSFANIPTNLARYFRVLLFP